MFILHAILLIKLTCAIHMSQVKRNGIRYCDKGILDIIQYTTLVYYENYIIVPVHF